MGDARKDALRVDFDRKLKLEFHGVKVTSDAGLLAYRELDDVFGLTDMVACELRDNRTGKNTQHSLLALLRQSIYSRLAGYEDTNDAERLCVDPAMRQVVGERAKDKTAGSVQKRVLEGNRGIQSSVITEVFTKTALITKILDCSR